MGDSGDRSVREVIESHLALRKAGEVEQDIEHNFSPDVVLLTGTGVYRGHHGVRSSSAELSRYLGEGTFHYRQLIVEGRAGFLEWAADGSGGRIRDGADSFVVEDGRIVLQTIHYTVDSD
jgi:hypothetical protein